MSTVVFDIGGTKTRLALFAEGEMRDLHTIPTPKDPNEGVERILEVTKGFLKNENVSAVVGCVAGRVENDGKISVARNLTGWVGFNIVEVLQTAFNAPVQVFNDGELVGLGEAVYGAGKGFSVVAYTTVSTGVGGARIINQSIDSGKSELHVGRIKVGDHDLEELVSGTAVAKRFGVHPKDIADIAVRVELAQTLAQGLTIVVKEWQPDALVLGGSMIVGQNSIPLDVVTAELTKHTNKNSFKMPIVKNAELGDVGGLWGAVAYTLQH
ncbi:hypothetical protein COU15_00640 [Candidatus Kaiserbacteria bacterium CG10_big_fil_rev_8_21_14_0_10_45_20]|uniref:ROK family protein n=1 Tax=Candidatus Kaiserbacteria bacterium CG10_big_fil_rev_8_21_14_0_10_45_20 TaxID=1974607 RepID=A0A2H0UGA0_9BACT|nr:MAG: hypothetical protein COU15_00640 [Candidatus Kaiserbacteria bacterium CG10_big_fil_rev_8_21_14_0_10_45_20]